MFVTVISPFVLKDEALVQKALPRLDRAMEAWCARTNNRRYEHLFCYDSLNSIKPAYMDRLKATHKHLRPILMATKHVGKGPAFSEGFAKAQGDLTVMFDFAEMIAPEDVVPLLDGIVDRGFDCVHAIRHQAGTHFEKQVKSENLVTHQIVGKAVTDFGTSCCALKTGLVKGIELMEDDHLFLPAILVRRGLTVENIGEAVARYEGAVKSTLGALLGGLGDSGRARKFQSRLKAGCYDKR